MERSTGATSPVKSTGIPRFSKLPTPKPVATTLSRPDREPAPKPLSRVASVRSKTAATPTPSRPATSKLESSSRRSSILAPGFVAPRPPSTQNKRPASPLKSSTSRPVHQLPRAQSPQKTTAISRQEEDHDQLGALDGFRTASRQSMREHSPADETCLQDDTEDLTPKPNRSSRLSLSDRTIESIFQLPSTPATDRRRSGFFAPESPMVTSPMGPPSRPASALSVSKRAPSRDSTLGRVSARPPSPVKRSIPTPQPNRRLSVDYSKATPARRTVSTSTQKPPPSSDLGSAARVTKPNFSASVSSVSQPPTRPAATKRPISMAARPSIKTANSNGSFSRSTTSARSTDSSIQLSQLDGAAEASSKLSKSSATLREQIARAKSAKRAAVIGQVSGSKDNSNGFDLATDPFNQRPKDNKGLLRKRIHAALTDGRLNIAALGLSEVPAEVLCMYDADQMAESNISWSEAVDLVRFVAADNEIVSIADRVFPDRDPAEVADEEDSKGSQFGGLELLDLHGNMLQTLPLGLRRLERLTILNLSHNNLGNAAWETICQISSLKDIKLGHNNISGYLPKTVGGLQSLEVLDLQANKILGLPECLKELSHLRVLNVSRNQLTGIPMDALETLPITELDVSSNALVGALFSFSVAGMSTLKDLNASNNSLASLAFSENLSLPALRILNIANNRIVSLPDMSGWSELTTLAAADNKLAEIPNGFTALGHIRQADFTSNDFIRLDDRIARMESLDQLLIAANPLRERKFLSMSADAIKRELRSRLAPSPSDQRQDDTSFEDEAIDVRSPEDALSPWKLGSSGALDLSSKDLTDQDSDTLRSFLGVNDVRELQLSRNRFSVIPFELSLAQNLRVLDMSMCSLAGHLLDEPMAFPKLRELYLTGNKLTTLEPLTDNLHAPYLQSLDVSNNRLSGTLPELRQSFPELIDLHAADNKIENITAQSLKGYHTAILARNNIHSVPADIGLLWFDGLRSLDIGSNAFRVPNYRVLDKGTEATMAWLRDRIPGYQELDDETF